MVWGGGGRGGDDGYRDEKDLLAHEHITLEGLFRRGDSSSSPIC